MIPCKNQKSKISKAKLLLEATFFIHHFYLPEVDIQVQNGQGVLSSLLRLHGHFGPVYLFQVNKNDDEEHCFLK
jgi:hypothetical protein